MEGWIHSRKDSFLSTAYNLSGALEAARMGRFVVLVDVIDMSTSLETVLEQGAVQVWGAAPVDKKSPYTNPYKIGQLAAREAKTLSAEIVLISEPRCGDDNERRKRAAEVLAGIAAEEMEVLSIVPNMGAETGRLLDWRGKIAIAVTDAGGTIFDAVRQLGNRISTATVARTLEMKGPEPAIKGIKRAFAEAKGLPITLVAASSNAIEDVLAVNYLSQLILSYNWTS